jgi:transposase
MDWARDDHAVSVIDSHGREVLLGAGTLMVISILVEQIKTLSNQIAGHADAYTFTGLPQSGRVRAKLLAEVGDCCGRFRTPETLACLAEVAPSTRESGTMRTVGFR